ncbi:hypothetical protein DICPUDRAFT_150223 [Dictyostelium purpureum]|uniref:Uncharacterized protein n=1 Tax=Dictyostelium purpureum TaxID=5786 RepID=F0ZFS2_DICPU|nr:uncharacterized protein DICPUDRAFT_150223 [Dictyostelium purpureum]EGC37206.1 hypothetical protein DICPUDRAFT_150223 [Dictyostelium purpureum]|eukprot:XP_003286257.1 hypothetical protein DICPUDRAFT_150223 [Dictyostelium purpureum]
MISDLNDKSNIFKLSRDEYLQNYNQSIDEIKIKDQVIESKSIEADHLSQKIKDLESSLQEEKSLLKQTIERGEENKNEFDSLSTKLKKLEEKLVLERSSFDSLNQRFNVVTLDNNNFEKRIEEMEKQIGDLEKEKETLESTSQAQKNKGEEDQNEIERLSAELKEKETLISQQENEIKEKTERLVDFEKIQEELSNVKESLSSTETKFTEVSERLAALEPQYEIVKTNYDEACLKITKLEVSLVDAETEKKISEKKNIKMIKDLKMELSQSRDSISQLSQSSSNIGGVSGQVTPTAPSPSLQRSAGSVSLPTTPNVTPVPSRHQRTISTGSAFQLSTQPNASPIKPPHPSSAHYSESTLRNDLETLGRKLGELGSENYKLEEKNRTLEQTNQMLLQEIDKKSKVVRFYISKTQLGRATTEDEKTKRLKGGITGSFWRNNDPKIVAEMVEKMEVMLQENILKNMQLSESIELLSGESTNLKTEIDIYKNLLKENSIDINSNFKNLHNHLNPTNNTNNTNNSNTNISIQVSNENLNDC